MGQRVLAAIILGVLGVVLLPHLKEPVEIILGFSSGKYSPFVQLFTDNSYIFLVVLWIVVILALLLWRRKPTIDEGE